MFNLLPELIKEKIKKDYKLRRLIVILISIIFLQISFIVFILPSWILSYYKEKETVLNVDIMNNSEMASTTNNAISAIKLINNRISVLGSVLEYPHVIPALDEILSKKNSSIHINEFNYNFGSEKSATISLSGLAATRESLVSFVKNLQDSNLFKSVDLPVSNLAQDKNLLFSITLTIST